MKKIIPFKKEIMFKTNVSEIVSISLENNLHKGKDNLITGNFIISGDYKIADVSVNTEKFSFELPFDINIDEKYILDNIVLDIDDFYYEIVNNKVMEVNIDVLIDKLEEKKLLDDADIVERCIEKEDILAQLENENIDDIKQDVEDKKDDKIFEVNNTNFKEEKSSESLKEELTEEKKEENVNSLFNNFDTKSDTYETYRVCIIREGDTIDGIMQKYGISKDILELYNNLSDIKLGDKLIIPSIINEKV